MFARLVCQFLETGGRLLPNIRSYESVRILYKSFETFVVRTLVLYEFLLEQDTRNIQPPYLIVPPPPRHSKQNVLKKNRTNKLIALKGFVYLHILPSFSPILLLSQ